MQGISNLYVNHEEMCYVILTTQAHQFTDERDIILIQWDADTLSFSNKTMDNILGGHRLTGDGAMTLYSVSDIQTFASSDCFIRKWDENIELEWEKGFDLPAQTVITFPLLTNPFFYLALVCVIGLVISSARLVKHRK